MGNLCTKTQRPEPTTPPTPQRPPSNVSLTKLFNVERFVVTTNDTLWGIQMYNKLLSIWQMLAVENGTIILLSGSHGTPEGEMKRKDMVPDDNGKLHMSDAAEFVKEDEEIVKILKKKKAGDFRKLNLQMKVVDVWQNVHSNGSINLEKLSEEIKNIQPTSVVAGWCFSKKAEIFLERFGVTSNLILQDDLMKVLGHR